MRQNLLADSDRTNTGHLRDPIQERSAFRWGAACHSGFALTDATRPMVANQLVLAQGYRHESYLDKQSQAHAPVILAAVSEELLFGTFMDLLCLLGPVADVVLEGTHTQDVAKPVEHYREQMDMSVLQSVLWEYEDLLVNDGCTGIAVFNSHLGKEVYFDEHKHLIIYSDFLAPFEDRLRQWGVGQNDEMKFLFESEHCHLSSTHYHQHFEQLVSRLSMETDFT